MLVYQRVTRTARYDFFCGLSKMTMWYGGFQPGLQRTCDRMPGQWELVQKPAAVEMLAFPAMSSSSTWTILKHKFQADLLVTWGGLKLGRCFFFSLHFHSCTAQGNDSVYPMMCPFQCLTHYCAPSHPIWLGLETSPWGFATLSCTKGGPWTRWRCDRGGPGDTFVTAEMWSMAGR